MIRGLYTAVSGLITQEAKQDVITNNMANTNTVGYKGDNLQIKSFNDMLLQNYDKLVGGKNVKNELGALSYGSKIDETTTDFSQGAIESSDNPTNFALDGKGFFAVQRTDMNGTSNTYYTRDGQFHINSQGALVTSSGDAVMGINSSTGKTEPIIVGNAKMVMDDKNNMYLNGKQAYKFSIADFANYSALQKVGDNLYSGNNPTNANNVSTKQNALEKSNVNLINEMVNMMTVMRTFESNQKVVQAMDETLGKAVNEVGTVR